MGLLTTDSTTLHATLPVGIEPLFALISDPDKMPQWLLGCRSAVADTGVRKGTRLQVNFGRGPVELLVTDFAPPNVFGWAEHGTTARQGSHTMFKLEFAGGSTNVSMRYVWSPKTLRAWIMGSLLRRRSARRMFETAMVELRRLLGR